MRFSGLGATLLLAPSRTLAWCGWTRQLEDHFSRRALPRIRLGRRPCPATNSSCTSIRCAIPCAVDQARRPSSAVPARPRALREDGRAGVRGSRVGGAAALVPGVAPASVPMARQAGERSPAASRTPVVRKQIDYSQTVTRSPAFRIPPVPGRRGCSGSARSTGADRRRCGAECLYGNGAGTRDREVLSGRERGWASRWGVPASSAERAGEWGRFRLLQTRRFALAGASRRTGVRAGYLDPLWGAGPAPRALAAMGPERGTTFLPR
jgi:hypothetical protein